MNLEIIAQNCLVFSWDIISYSAGVPMDMVLEHHTITITDSRRLDEQNVYFIYTVCNVWFDPRLLRLLQLKKTQNVTTVNSLLHCFLFLFPIINITCFFCICTL